MTSLAEHPHQGLSLPHSSSEAKPSNSIEIQRAHLPRLCSAPQNWGVLNTCSRCSQPRRSPLSLSSFRVTMKRIADGSL